MGIREVRAALQAAGHPVSDLVMAYGPGGAQVYMFMKGDQLRTIARPSAESDSESAQALIQALKG